MGRQGQGIVHGKRLRSACEAEGRHACHASKSARCLSPNKMEQTTNSVCYGVQVQRLGRDALQGGRGCPVRHVQERRQRPPTDRQIPGRKSAALCESEEELRKLRFDFFVLYRLSDKLVFVRTTLDFPSLAKISAPCTTSQATKEALRKRRSWTGRLSGGTCSLLYQGL